MTPDPAPPHETNPKSERRRPPGWIALALADWATRWPAIFEKPTPLAIGFARQIHAELKPQFTRKEIGVALHHWVTRRSYYQALARGDVRRNLDGSEAGFPDETCREMARSALAAFPRRTANQVLPRATAPDPASAAEENEKPPASP